MTHSDPFRIGVIVGRDLIGDALIKLPFLRALRTAFPQAYLHWLTSHGPTAYASALRSLTVPLLDAIDECPSWLPLAGGEEKGNIEKAPAFDLLIDTRGKWREALAVRPLCGDGLFIAPALRYAFSKRRPPLFSAKPRRMIDRLLQMAELASGQKPCLSLRLQTPPALDGAAQRLIPDGLTAIGFAPGAGNKVKIWPRERFIAVAKAQADLGRTPVFLLGPDEENWRESLRAQVPTALFPLQERHIWGSPTMALEETLAIGKRLRLAVANDSGTSHMLAAVDCPLISLFGPTEAAKLAPMVTQGAVLRAQDFGGTAMDKIPIPAVLQAIENLV